MTDEHLLKEVKLGRILLVGEYRGSQAEISGYVDRKSGEKITYVRAIHLLECSCRGNVERAIIYEVLPEIIETPEEAVLNYRRGSLYVFYLSRIENQRGQIIGYMAQGKVPELLERPAENEGVQPVAAPSGAVTGCRP